MTNKKNKIEYTDRLLGAKFLKDIKNIPSVNRVVSTHAIKNCKIFEEKMIELDIQHYTENDISKAVKKKLIVIEKKLQKKLGSKILSNKENLRKTASDLFDMCPNNMKAIYSLRKKTIISLLKKKPPKKLMAHLNKNTIEKLVLHIDPFEIISLARHTEPDSWQKNYKKQLSVLNSSHFEKRRMNICIIDSLQYASLLESRENKQKPWFISHNKEIGTITCFTHDPRIDFLLPVLMFTTVFFHYFFETYYAGLFNSNLIKNDPKKVGKRFIDSISNDTKHLVFFNPHSYSESLYWDKAIGLFHNKFRFKENNFFETTLSCGVFLEDNKIISLNIIDRIWDVNFLSNKKTALYFKTQPYSNFTYHFQEMYWYKVFPKILKIKKQKMTEQIIEHSDMGDSLFTQKMITKYAFRE